MAYSKKPRESLRVYYNRLEQVESAFAGLQRLSEQLRVAKAALQNEEKEIGWDKVNRAASVQFQIEVIQDTIQQEWQWRLEELEGKNENSPRTNARRSRRS